MPPKTSVSKIRSKSSSQNKEDGVHDKPAAVQNKSNKSKEDDTLQCINCDVVFAEESDKLLECERCGKWVCLKCSGLDDQTYDLISKQGDLLHWYCSRCKHQALTEVRMGNLIETKCRAMDEKIDKFKRDLEKRLAEERKQVDTKLSSMQTEIEEIKLQINQGHVRVPDSSNSTNQEEVVKEVCINISDRIARQKNIVIFNLSEADTNNSKELEKVDKEHIENIVKVTAGIEEARITVRRLGKREKGQDEEDSQSSKNRPLLVTLPTEEAKVKVMKNLHNLRNSPYNHVSVKHDMTRQEREEEKKLREEARQKNEEENDPNFHYLVRGLPWDRKITKVKKKNRGGAEGGATNPTKDG